MDKIKFKMNLNEFNRLIEEMKTASSELRISSEMFDFPCQPTTFSKTHDYIGVIQEPMIDQWKDKAQNELKSFKSEFLENLIESANEISKAYSSLKELQYKFQKEIHDYLIPLVSKRNEIGLKLALPYIKEIKKGLYQLPDDNKMEIEYIWLEEGKKGLYLILYGYIYNGNIREENRSRSYLFIDKPSK